MTNANVNWTALNAALCEALKIAPERVEWCVGLPGSNGLFCYSGDSELKAQNWHMEHLIYCEERSYQVYREPIMPNLISDVSRLLKLLAAQDMSPTIGPALGGNWCGSVLVPEMLYSNLDPEPGHALALAAAAALGLEVPRG